MTAEEPFPPQHTIGCDLARTLPGLFRQRVKRTPGAIAYRQYEGDAWRDYTWAEMARLVARWQRGLESEGLLPGERVALSLRNCVEWVCFDQAALGLGLVPVPIYTTDSPGNTIHILADSGARLLLLDSDRRWLALAPGRAELPGLRRVLCLNREISAEDDSVRYPGDWLPQASGALEDRVLDPDSLATIVYTSGTTGPSKGVMQCHRGILWTAEAVLRRIPARPTDTFLSFLPLAHSFERTVGYYLPMMAGSCICYARSVELLGEDLPTVRPTVLLSVPRVYDKIYLAIQARLGERGLRRSLFDAAVELGWQRFVSEQGRGPALGLPKRLAATLLHRLVAQRVLDRLGGRVRVAASGGAPLSPAVAHFFIGLGLPLAEGYGLTEASPALTNTRPQDCVPGSVGQPLPGVRIRIGPQGELFAHTPGRMLGYWGQPEATAAALDEEGWLHTGDLGEIRDGYIHIRGRLKEILVTSTGEKIAPAELELALAMDPLIEQAMVVGDSKPFLAALLVLEPGAWRRLAQRLGLDPDATESLAHPSARAAVLSRVQGCLDAFPGFARVRAVHLCLEPWTVDDGLLTPTMKVRRDRLELRFAEAIHRIYGPLEVPWEAS